VQERKALFFPQEQRNQKPSHAPVAVKEGVYGLKLVMYQSRANQHIKPIVGVEVSFKV
jgi:hypothetical protein